MITLLWNDLDPLRHNWGHYYIFLRSNQPTRLKRKLIDYIDDDYRLSGASGVRKKYIYYWSLHFSLNLRIPS